MQNRRKSVEKLFRKLGATRAYKTDHSTVWEFPDGARHEVPTGVKGSYASRLMRDAQDRYGKVQTSVASWPRVHDAPKVDLGKLVASAHAQERLKLMVGQSDEASFAELTRCITHPRCVVASPGDGNLVWVGDALAVPLSFTDDTIVITTVLWATTDRYEDNPRPEVYA